MQASPPTRGPKGSPQGDPQGVLDVPGGLMQPHEFCGWQQGTDILEYQNSTPVPATTSTV